MPQVLKEIQDFMQQMGLPGRDLYELPSSDQTFPDGANYRIEIAGIERASSMEALIDEMKRRNTPVHRVIPAVVGATYLDFEELRPLAQMARDE